MLVSRNFYVTAEPELLLWVVFSLCGCGGFYGTTRIALNFFAFIKLVVLHLWMRYGSSYHRIHGTAYFCMRHRAKFEYRVLPSHISV